MQNKFQPNICNVGPSTQVNQNVCYIHVAMQIVLEKTPA